MLFSFFWFEFNSNFSTSVPLFQFQYRDWHDSSLLTILWFNFFTSIPVFRFQYWDWHALRSSLVPSQIRFPYSRFSIEIENLYSFLWFSSNLYFNFSAVNWHALPRFWSNFNFFVSILYSNLSAVDWHALFISLVQSQFQFYLFIPILTMRLTSSNSASLRFILEKAMQNNS